MAFTSSKVAQSLAGNLRMEIHSCNFAGVTTGDVSIGIKNILFMAFNNEVTEGEGLVTKSGQTVTISSVTSNDTGSLLVIGNG
jgi:hypothetical protein